MEAKQTTFTMRLDTDFHKEVRMFAFKKGVTVKSIFVEHMKKLLAEEEERSS